MRKASEHGAGVDGRSSRVRRGPRAARARSRTRDGRCGAAPRKAAPRADGPAIAAPRARPPRPLTAGGHAAARAWRRRRRDRAALWARRGLALARAARPHHAGDAAAAALPRLLRGAALRSRRPRSPSRSSRSTCFADVAHQDAARAKQALGDIDGAAAHLRLAARIGPRQPQGVPLVDARQPVSSWRAGTTRRSARSPARRAGARRTSRSTRGTSRSRSCASGERGGGARRADRALSPACPRARATAASSSGSWPTTTALGRGAALPRSLRQAQHLGRGARARDRARRGDRGCAPRRWRPSPNG